MHESGIIEELLAKIEVAARENLAKKVIAVDLSIGALAGIGPDHLREHFEVASAGTIAQGAELRMSVSDDPFGPEPNSILLKAIEVET